MEPFYPGFSEMFFYFILYAQFFCGCGKCHALTFAPFVIIHDFRGKSVLKQVIFKPFVILDARPNVHRDQKNMDKGKH